MNDTNIQTYTQRANIDIVDTQTMQEATSTLSWLNTQLDTLTAEKEKVTKPLNEALKAERNRFKPAEQALQQAIDQIRHAMTQYATNQANIAKAKESQILADKRTTTETKITKLATIDNTATDKITTENGSVSFTTVKKYSLTKPLTELNLVNLVFNNILVLDLPTLKAYIKTTGNTPDGITTTEEQSIRNYRG